MLEDLGKESYASGLLQRFGDNLDILVLKSYFQRFSWELLSKIRFINQWKRNASLNSHLIGFERVIIMAKLYRKLKMSDPTKTNEAQNNGNLLPG